MEGPPEGSSPIWESNEDLKVDKPPTTDLTNTIELSGTPSSVSGFIAPEVVGRAKSGTPQAFGILAIILAVFGVIISLLALLAIPTELDIANSVGENSTFFVIWTYLEPIIAIIAFVIFGYAGAELYNYKKRAIFIGLGALSINVVSGLIGSYVTSVVTTSTTDSEELGQIFGSLGVVFVLFCNACCGMIMVLPLLISPQDLE